MITLKDHVTIHLTVNLDKVFQAVNNCVPNNMITGIN